MTDSRRIESMTGIIVLATCPRYLDRCIALLTGAFSGQEGTGEACGVRSERIHSHLLSILIQIRYLADVHSPRRLMCLLDLEKNSLLHKIQRPRRAIVTLGPR